MYLIRMHSRPSRIWFHRFHPPAADGLTVDQIPLRLRAATNPGGIGGDWVRKRYVDPETAIRPFLSGRVHDNPGLNAEEYLASLAELPEVARKPLEAELDRLAGLLATGQLTAAPPPPTLPAEAM